MSEQLHVKFAMDYDQPYVADVHFRLYEVGNEEPVLDNIGNLNFSYLMSGRDPGEYPFYTTAVKTKIGWESEPSNTVTVDFTQPAAPTNLRVEGYETVSVTGSVG